MSLIRFLGVLQPAMLTPWQHMAATSMEFPYIKSSPEIDLSKAHEQVGKVVNQGVQWNKEPAAVAAVAAAPLSWVSLVCWAQVRATNRYGITCSSTSQKHGMVHDMFKDTDLH